MSRKSAFVLALAGSLALPAVAGAAVVYSGGTYSQNFDTLPNAPQNTSLGATPAGWIDDNAAPPAGNFSIVGWYLFHPTLQTEGGANGHQRMRIGAGTATTGAFMSWGASGSTERGLGMLSSNTMSVVNGESYYGLRLTNNTSDTLTAFSLSYLGEQWRDGGLSTTGSIAQSTTFDYSTNATAIEDAAATWTDVSSLDFTSPQFGATAGTAVDGNAVNTSVSDHVTGLNWAPGTDLWLRWTDINDSSNDHGLGIDDLSFEAFVPEPGSLSVLAVGAAGLLARRRR